ncbi:unnamed protein product [Ceratitis capitata]|uniref:(Mediterranean fruit fly) hypothetical protein n=1 Tax=Ceratitis capitata TaxID=7213 RepID=A0A811VAA4_CERCA|nr:unnamed protein product [Ceratitis capitata]
MKKNMLWSKVAKSAQPNFTGSTTPPNWHINYIVTAATSLQWATQLLALERLGALRIGTLSATSVYTQMHTRIHVCEYMLPSHSWMCVQWLVEW